MGLQDYQAHCRCFTDRDCHRYTWIPHAEHKSFRIASMCHTHGNWRGHGRLVYEISGSKIVSSSSVLGCRSFKLGAEGWNCLGYTNSRRSKEVWLWWE